MRSKSVLVLATLSIFISNVQLARAGDHEVATYQFDTQVSLISDLRTRGVTDSAFDPAVKLSMQFAHESGFVAIADLVTVSKDEFPDGNGTDLTLAAGYRFGDPDAWHFGVGLAAEIFPGAKFTAPHTFDGMSLPTDYKDTSYDSNFAVFEIGYGAVQGRVLYVVSPTYRGADTGGVCGAMLQYTTDPYMTAALDCYARGDQNSRGTLLYDLDYKVDLSPITSLTLHAGYQKVANFPEADFADYGISLTHKQWGLDWTADYVTTRTKTRELFLVEDGSDLRRTDNDKLVLSVSYSF